MRMFAFILLLVSLSGFAQPRLDRHYVYKKYSTYDGLVQSQVNSIMQDSKGYLWVCTKGGLSRFDGKNFQNFVDTKDGDRVNINNIVETEIGFFVSSPKKIFKFSYEEENPQNWKFEDIGILGYYRFDILVSYFYNSTENSLYIFNLRKDGFYGTNFIHLKYDFNRQLVQRLPLGKRQIRFSYNSEGSRICLTMDSIFFLKNSIISKRVLPKQFDNYALDPADSCLYAYQISSKTVFRIDRDFQLCKPVLKGISLLPTGNPEPNYFLINKSGQFVFINEKREITLISHLGTKNVAPVNFVRSLFISRENNLWVCTEEGIFNFFKLDFEQYVFNIAKSLDNVWSIVCDLDSTMWFGGYSTGLWTLNKHGKIKVYGYFDFKMPFLQTHNFPSIYMGGIRDNEGRIYIPSAAGMLVIDKSKLSYRDTKTVPMSITDDAKNNRLIVGKAFSLEIIEKGTLKTLIDVAYSNSIVSTCINRDDKVMASSLSKQLILEGDSLKPYPSVKKLGVISMVKDEQDNIWKGTPVGLYLDDGKTETEILPKTIVGSVVSVFIKKPWLMATTAKNMYLINLDEFYRNSRASAYQFGAENGYIAMDGGQNGFCEDNEGKIWYTVTDKVLRFSPDSLVSHFVDYVPKPHFASFSYSNNAIDWIRIEPGDSTELVCGHNFNSIRVNMAAVSETRAEKLVFQYRLKGMSDEWSQPTKITQQTFTNLAPGKYSIEIRSSLDGERWSEIVKSQPITIKSAWWQTWWAYLIEIVLFGFIIAAIVIYFLKRRQKIIVSKLMEQKRLNELRLQSVRSKNIPHFSGNALANIEHFIFNADLRQANKFLSKYSRLMNITLRDADKAGRSIEQEVEYVRLYLELEKMRFGDQLEYVIEVDETVNQSKELPNMIMQTWVENAIKHGIRHKEGVGRILVKVANNNSHGISVSVEDNGIGRARAKELGTTGTGQGLAILDEQIAIYNQVNPSKIFVNTVDLVGQDGLPLGTRFEMYIPSSFRFDA